MKREDFVFDHMDDEYEDYWFKVVGDTKDELTKKYMEMCMVSVTEVVYSNKEQALGVKRLSHLTTMLSCQMIRSSGICWYLLWLSRILDFYGRFNCCARHYGYHSSTNVCRV